MAYRASDGELLWQSWAPTGIIAPPISYEIDGTQYIAVMAGFGGAFASRARNEGKIFAFAIGGDTAAAAAGRRPPREPPTALEQTADAAAIARGADLFGVYCARCHGGGTTLPDLRHSEPDTFDRYPNIVLQGSLAERGMPVFAEDLDLEQVRAITAWVIDERNRLAR